MSNNFKEASGLLANIMLALVLAFIAGAAKAQSAEVQAWKDRNCMAGKNRKGCRSRRRLRGGRRGGNFERFSR